MRHGRFNSITVDIALDDIIDQIDTDDLEAELIRRGRKLQEATFIVNPQAWIEKTTGSRLFALSDEEICEHVLKSLGRFTAKK